MKTVESSGVVVNGMRDAFRHCYWRALLTIHLGWSTATMIADAHERTDGNPFEQATGIGLGTGVREVGCGK
jgi:hypothetical protein